MAQAKADRRGLGRGLSALMADVDRAPENKSEAPSGTPAPRKAELMIDIALIEPNPEQPRRSFDHGALRELADSIKEKGVIQPLILRKNPRNPDGYEIVAGERRWRASQLAQLHEVPAIVRELNDTEVLELAIIENIQRADLNAIEEARGYRQLMDSFGHTQEQLSEALGKSRSHIANMLRLLNLPDMVQGLLTLGDLTMGHARALLSSNDPMKHAQEVVKRSLSVRETEELVKRKRPKPTNTTKVPPLKDADTRQIERDLSAALGMSVLITHRKDGESGVLTVRYSDLEQLDEVCRRLSVTVDAGKV